MGRSLLLAALAALALAAPAGSAGGAGERLVLGVAVRDRDLGAVVSEWAVVIDPASGDSRKRRLRDGTLCHGPVLAVRGRVVFSGHRGGREVALSLPLSLRGRARGLDHDAVRWPARVPRPDYDGPLPTGPRSEVISLATTR